MSYLFSSSGSIGSPMAVKPFAFSCPLITRKAILGRGKVACFCAVRNDGNPTQAGGAQVQIRCSFANKVYEDPTKGIACYIDEEGEIVCEGYDEGPRTDSTTPCPFGHLRDGDMGEDFVKLLERTWFRFADDGSECTMEADYSTEDILN